jgi:hypothetical protein
MFYDRGVKFHSEHRCLYMVSVLSCVDGRTHDCNKISKGLAELETIMNCNSPDGLISDS